MDRNRFLLTAALCTMWAQDATAQDAQSIAFGQRERVSQVSISPDGTHIAMVTSTGTRGSAVQVVDLATKQSKAILGASGDPERLTDCHWSTDTRLVCRFHALERDPVGLIGYTRAVAVDADGKNMHQLSARTNDRSLDIMQNGGTIIDWTGSGDPGSVLATRDFVPEDSTGTRMSSSAEGRGVERIDTRSLARRTVEPAKPTAVDYISDGLGTVRIMGLQPSDTQGRAGAKVDYFYRRAGSRDWQSLASATSHRTGRRRVRTARGG